LLCTLSIANATWALDFSLADAEAAWRRGDTETARMHWQGLAEQGDVLASNNLGHLYENGIGVERDFNKSFELYRRAADAGVPVAQFNVGQAYAQGHGPKQDSVEALKWYMLAAAGGDEDAASAVQRLQQTLGVDDQGEAALRVMDWRREHKKRKPQP
jgi:TPR repeat protein